MNRLVLSLLLGASLLLSTLSHANAEPARERFAVVIGNNHSLLGDRPDLHYADDDAARYYDIFRTIAAGHTYLLASFDRDTARLFPETHALSLTPSVDELVRVGREIAEAVRAAKRRGRESELYFVFAGHGDVDQGTGFIELADARFTARELENWLTEIPFSRAHVILDSCNSFFMLGVRKPGGRFFATPTDAAHSLASRLPNVGVFLSTSAEGETFEWSEIQSGIFSHVVRSGLLGAADANGDGAVSYVELGAFVATATADVRNPNMRPHAFARGPSARDDTPIVSLRSRSHARQLRIVDGAPLRVRLRDRESMPLFDAHAEAGVGLDLVLPESWVEGAVLDRFPARGTLAKSQSYGVKDAGTDLELTLPSDDSALASSRGPGEIFRKLFTRPFGPRALAEYTAESRTAPPHVFGVSREDSARMHLLLDQISSAEHGQRIVTGTYALGASAVFGLMAASTFAFDRRLPNVDKRGADITAGVYLGVGTLFAGFGAYTLARPWAGERIFDDFRATLAAGGDHARAFARADEELRELAAAERRRRWYGGITGGALVLGGATWLAVGEFSSDTADGRLSSRVVGGSMALLGSTAVAYALFIESPIERLTNVWRQEPNRLQWTPSLVATPGGALVGAVGQF